jgi:hypothetical protein
MLSMKVRQISDTIFWVRFLTVRLVGDADLVARFLAGLIVLFISTESKTFFWGVQLSLCLVPKCEVSKF